MVLEKTLRWIALGAIFLLPFVVLIVARSMFFPFIVGKNFAFRILVEIAAGAWLPLALIYHQYRPRRSWILWALVAFVFLIGLSDFFGVNPFKSFWSNFERMEGWVTLAHLLVLFVVASSLFTEKLWKAWWNTSLGASIIVVLYGFLQLGGLITINQGGVRLDATLGNATYLAIYMVFHIFIAWAFLARAWREEPRSRVPYAWLYGGIVVLDSIILFFTATRGALLGLVGGALLTGILFIVMQPRSKVAWRAGVGVIAIFILVGAFFLVKDQAWVRSIGPLDRLASISFTERTTISRFYNWGMAWEGIKERPVLGWGQENYAIVFDKYYDPRMWAQEPWFDRVHNSIFDWWVAGGTLGLLAYLSIWAAALLALWRAGPETFSPSEKSILTGLFAGYMFYNIFTFDNITSYVLFIAVLGWIHTRTTFSSPRVVEGYVPERGLPLVAACAVLVLWGSAWYVNADAIAQNRTLISAMSPHSEGVSKNLELFKKAIAYQSIGTQEVREQLAQGAPRIAPLDVDLATKQAFFDLATSEMKSQEQVSPLDARFPLFLGIVYNAFGDYADGKDALLRAHGLSQKKQAILFLLSRNADALGDKASALSYLKQAYELAPEYPEARILYTVALIQAGENARADEILAPLMETGEASDVRIISAYMDRKLYAKAAAIAEAHVQAKPEDMQGYFTLAAVYYASGNRPKAVETLQRVAAIAPPDVKAQAETLIEQVRKGTAQLQ